MDDKLTNRWTSLSHKAALAIASGGLINERRKNKNVKKTLNVLHLRFMTRP